MRRFFKNFLLRFHEFTISRAFTRKMVRVYKRRGKHQFQPHPSMVKKFLELWKPMAGKVDPRWLSNYVIFNGMEDERYVPLGVYYVHVEPVLNNKRFTAAYSDKNSYDLLFPDIRKPHIHIRCIDGTFFDHYYRKLDAHGYQDLCKGIEAGENMNGDLILKPAIDGGMGRGVIRLKYADGAVIGPDHVPMTLKKLRAMAGRNFLIQAFAEQHPALERLNPGSLNTIRVLTYRSVSDEKIIPLHFLQKIGSPGSVIDHKYRIGIKPDGRYNAFCNDSSGARQTAVNGISLKSLEPLPFMNELSACALEVAQKCIHSRMLGIDLSVDKSGRAQMIEVNTFSVGIENIQLNNGPLFGEYTGEVIDYCLKNKRTYNYFFER